ncbi:MAG: RIP metalloprotease RseP [Armatimonadetes bacterium]|nr:RIP metalloprotease RseP [Armatimonadota bacterium]
MTIISLIVFIILLGILVFFHELGHFLAAKSSGMRVEEFAFGFGPRMITLFKREGTEYTIHWVPLGGFVKIAGMEPGQEDISDGFQAQAIWKRALVIFAGPLFSFILGVGVLVSVGVLWGFQDFSEPQPRVGSVQPGTEAASIGLRAGDRVLEINGKRISTGAQMTEIIHDKPGQRITVLLDRDGKTIRKTARPRWSVQYADTNWSFMKGDDPVAEFTNEKLNIKKGDTLISIGGRLISGGENMVWAIEQSGAKPTDLVLKRDNQEIATTIKPDAQWVRAFNAKWLFPGGYVTSAGSSTADSSGVRRDDILVSINGKKIKSGHDMLAAIQKEGKYSLEVLRKGEPKALTATLGAVSLVDSGIYRTTGLLGFLPAPSLIKVGFTESVKEGFIIVGRMVELLMKTLTSSRIKEDIGGPVLIAKVTQSSVALGPYWVLLELGSLSLGLAVINLVPIPAVLDGGHLLLLGIEAVRRKRWSRNQMAMMQMVGFSMVAALIVLIFVSDITKIVTGQIPQ